MVAMWLECNWDPLDECSGLQTPARRAVSNSSSRVASSASGPPQAPAPVANNQQQTKPFGNLPKAPVVGITRGTSAAQASAIYV